MMQKNPKKNTPWQVIIALGFVTTLSLARANTSDWYDVELIVFEQHSHQTKNSEVLEASPFYLPSKDQAIQLGATPKESRLGAMTGFPYHRLPQSSYRLKPNKHLLNKHGLSIVLHTAWRQRINTREASLPVYINTLEQKQQKSIGVLGTVRLTQEGPLILNLDLAYQTQETQTPVRLKDNLVVHLDKSVYFDHPRLSVVAHVRQNSESGVN